MFFRILVVTFVGLFLGACSSSVDGSSVDRKTVTIQQYTVSWADYEKLARGFRGDFSLAEGEKVYLFSVSKERKITLSNGKQVAAGNCHLAANPIDPKTSELYAECASKDYSQGRATGAAQSLSQSVKLGEKAVKQEGSCQWIRYNRAFDLRVRAKTAVFPASVGNAFFIKLRC